MNRERILAALDRCPQTLCHRDAYPTNLMGTIEQQARATGFVLDMAEEALELLDAAG